jgi:hypothetical protein
MPAVATADVVGRVPDWVLAEMPPGYQTRRLEIERLAAELRDMDAIARVLWENGPPLEAAAAAIFTSMRCEVDPASGTGSPLLVNLDGRHRLLVHVARGGAPIEKTSDDVTRAFQFVQYAGERDRVVVVPGNESDAAPSNRAASVQPDALKVLQRMGVNVLEPPALFRLWRLSFEDAARARALLERLHAQDGGSFTVS